MPNNPSPGSRAHTPGPWIADAIAENGDIRVACVGLPLVIASVHNGAAFVEVLTGRHPATQWANATLIAAAPEMLAALKDILELFEDQEDIKDGAAGGQLPNDAMRACMIVRAAITKAEAA